MSLTEKPWTKPDHFVDPAKKKELEWNANYVRYYWSRYGSSTGSMSLANRNAFIAKITLNRQYSNGRQSVRQYMPLLGHTEQQIKENKSHMAIDWRLPQIWPKFRDIVLSKMNQISYGCKASLIDPVSLLARAQAKYEMECKVRLAPLLVQWNADAGANVSGISPDLPTSMEELDIAFDMNYKEAYALAAEKGIDLTLYENDYREIKKKLEEDEIDIDMVCCRTYIDNNNKVRLKYIDPSNIILPQTADREFKKQQIGEVMRVTISELRELDRFNQLKESDLQDICQKFTNRFGNPREVVTAYMENRGWAYDDFVVEVLFTEYPTIDIYRTRTRKDRHGNSVTYVENFDSKKADNQYKVPMWYQCYWVIDSNYYFGYGPAQAMNRSRAHPENPKTSFHIYSNTWNGENTNSITDRVIGFVNGFTISYFKFQDEIARARPSGYYIDVDAISNIVLAGVAFTPKENLQTFLRSGVLVGRSKDEEGNTIQKPVYDLPASLQSVEPHIQTMMVYINNIRETTGINEFVDGSTGQKEYSATATREMVSASDNAIYRCVDAVSANFLKICEGIVNRLQQVVMHKPIEATLHAIGELSVEALKIGSEFGNQSIGLILEESISQQQRQWLEQQIAMGMEQRQKNGKGGIELEDALAIRACRNIKQAERMLSIRRKRREKADTRTSMAISKQQADIQTQSGLRVEQERQRTLEIELQIFQAKEAFLTTQLKQREQDKADAEIRVKLEGDAVVAATKQEGAAVPN